MALSVFRASTYKGMITHPSSHTHQYGWHQNREGSYGTLLASLMYLDLDLDVDFAVESNQGH